MSPYSLKFLTRQKKGVMDVITGRFSIFSLLYKACLLASLSLVYTFSRTHPKVLLLPLLA